MERLVPSTRLVEFSNPSVSKTGRPQIHPSAFVSPSSSVIGGAEIGAGSSVWYNAVVRADVNTLSIGSGSSIGDGCTVHVAKIAGDFGTKIGHDVTVSAGGVVHACEVGDRVHLGVGSQVLDGAVVGNDVMILPGRVVTPGTKVGDGEVWGGNPAKMLRKTTEAEKKFILDTAERNVELARLHKEENEKDYLQVQEDEEMRRDVAERDPEYFQWGEHNSNVEDVIDRGVNMGEPGQLFENTLESAHGTGKEDPTNNPR